MVTGLERGIASAMTYEAKARGVTRGMRVSEIKKVFPDVVLLPSDYETYSLFSKRMFATVRRYTLRTEIVSGEFLNHILQIRTFQNCLK